MDRPDSSRNRYVGRTIVALAAVFGVLQTATAVDFDVGPDKIVGHGHAEFAGMVGAGYREWGW